MESIDKELLEKVGVVAICLVISYMIVKHICTYLKIDKEPLTVLVTAAAGEIGYALVPMIAQGAMLGKDQPVILHLLDTNEASEELKAVRMELIDSAFPLLQGVIATTDVVEACTGVEIGLMLHEFPLEEGMERKEFVSKNVLLYKEYASALDKHATDYCKVVVAAYPANTNALILKDFNPTIQAKNITFVTRLDHNRALAQISEKLGIHVSGVKNVVIWGGNDTSTRFPDANHTVVATNDGQRHVLELLASDDQWLDGELIKAGKHRTTFSTAKAICDHAHDWIHATPKGTWVSMGVWSDGSYGIEPDVFYSFPVTCHNGEWSIVQGLKINVSSRRKMDEKMKELAQERDEFERLIAPLRSGKVDACFSSHSSCLFHPQLATEPLKDEIKEMQD